MSPSSFLAMSGDLWQALGLTLELAAVTTAILGVVGLPLAETAALLAGEGYAPHRLWADNLLK